MFKRRMKNRVRTIIIAIALLLSVTLIGSYAYISDYYHASASVKEYLQNSADVTVEEGSTYLFLDGPGEDKALLFYPGGKVEYTAYAPLLRELAESGMDCFLLQMPGNIAFLGVSRASAVIEKYQYPNWYIGGHSLGGVAAAMYAANHDLSGLILLASYPTKEIDERTLSLYGSEDGVLNREAFAEGEQYLPESSDIVVIRGGNHAQFGDYGLQEGDGEAFITGEEQRKITVQEILQFVNE